jgi:outer membrane protein insertion porin family
MRFLNCRILLATLALAPAPCALAQYTIRNIEIQGAAPYTNDEVLQVSGLRPGQMMAHNSLGDAAQHLLDTGVFADAGIELTGAGTARTVVIELKPLPAASFAPVTFANLPWWSPAELDAALRKAVPLYRGGIPPAGNLPDTLDAALTTLLAARGVHATVSNASVPPSNAHPQLTWEFRLDDPAVRLASVNLSGTPAALAPAMQRVVRHISGFPYNDGDVSDDLLAPLRDAGYLDAQLGSITTAVDPASSAYAVRYTATVVPGDPFHVTTIGWQPTSIYAQHDFTHDAKLHSGDLASQKALLATEQSILNAYLHLGYLDAYIDAHPQEDKTDQTVSYSLAVTPGEIYRIKSVTPLNLSAAARKDFDFGWLLKPGTPYDPIYAANFLTNNTALLNLAGYTASFQAAADSQTHLVDLTINFVHPGSGQ